MYEYILVHAYARYCASCEPKTPPKAKLARRFTTNKYVLSCLKLSTEDYTAHRNSLGKSGPGVRLTGMHEDTGRGPQTATAQTSSLWHQRHTGRMAMPEVVDSSENASPLEVPRQEVGTTTAAKPPQRRLIYARELLVAVLYPTIMFLGQLIHMTSQQETYFASKRNLFNIIFVKRAWLWTTAAFGGLAYAQVAGCAPARKQAVATKLGLRYLAASLWWVLYAQWFFGMPLMDRVFVLTGGECSGVELKTPVSSAACRSLGGKWTGGYDPSGHAFLLVHASLFLWLEIFAVQREFKGKPTPVVTKLATILVVLWAWMLLMTSIYFHSLLEKIAGLICGYAEVVAILAYSRLVPIGHQMIGL